MGKRYENNRVLFIPDTHAPYHHRDVFDFLKAIKEEYGPDRVFQLGDWTDSYCFSRYPKDISHTDTYSDEYRKVRKFTDSMVEIFPKGIAMKGNHDARLWERAKVAGIPKGLLLSYEEVIGLKDTDWEMKWDYTFTVDATRDQWYMAHTKSSSALATAQRIGMSTIFGHEHTKFEIMSFATPEKRVYGVTAGCLLGHNRMAFAYNRMSIVRPNRGCVVLTEGVPHLVPFDETPSGKWNKKLRVV